MIRSEGSGIFPVPEADPIMVWTAAEVDANPSNEQANDEDDCRCSSAKICYKDFALFIIANANSDSPNHLTPSRFWVVVFNKLCLPLGHANTHDCDAKTSE